MNYNNFNQFFIYQLNTRNFCIENQSSILKASDSFFLSPEIKSSDAVWLMGVWKKSPASVKICKEHRDLIQEFRKALPDYKEEDIIGSPYAIYEYEPNPLVANHILELKQFRFKLNTLGKKLILDFVPNHVSVDSPYIEKFPDLFLYKKEANASICKNSFLHKNGRIYFHGRDPYFDGWTDTVQWDFSNPDVLSLHKKILLEISEVCDGLRCDMAMLPLEDVFKRTHGIDALPYWQDLIQTIKDAHSDFVFIAEVYWNREYDLQQLGFDFTYDKTLYDRLKNKDSEGVRLHLEASQDYQNHSLRFIENHDEERAIITFKESSASNFALLSFLPGAILYHQGQRNGRQVKIPVQLARSLNEPKDELTENFYSRVFETIQKRQNKSLELEIFELQPYGEEYSLKDCIVRSIWNGKDKCLEILIYNSYLKPIMGALHLTESIQKIVSEFIKSELILKDLVSGDSYSREKAVLLRGMFIQLEAGKAHWFVIDLNS